MDLFPRRVEVVPSLIRVRCETRVRNCPVECRAGQECWSAGVSGVFQGQNSEQQAFQVLLRPVWPQVGKQVNARHGSSVQRREQVD